MKITVAKSAGFCFGVNRAVELVYGLLDQGEKVCTLGPIIHNPSIVEDLRKRGVTILSSVEEAPQEATVVIRSHGVPKKTIDELRKKGQKCADATCPFVLKIHDIVQKAAQDNITVLVAGDAEHPEVEGICGYCVKENGEPGKIYVFRNAEELENLINLHNELCNETIIFVCQTTFNLLEWKNCFKIIKKVCTNATTFDTICNATAKRQREAEELAKNSDLMIVVGGHHSSNTAKLREVCEKYCRTCLVETADELSEEVLRTADSVGVTAGASTPAYIIKEVLVTMSEEIKETAKKAEGAQTQFEEMLEESLKTLNTDEKVHGVVVGISPTEVYVDVGRKQAGFIPAAELSNDPSVKPEDVVKIGDEMDLLIMRTNDQEGTIMLSKKRIDSIRGWEVITAAEVSKDILEGTVAEVIKGGLIVVTQGVRVFVPASQATASRNDPLEELVGKTVKLRIIEVNRQRRRAVGSIRSVLREERKAKSEEFWNSIEEGQEFTGKVKSLTPYGAFVDLGGTDGMIHISELSWSRIKHPSEVVNVGDEVTVYVKGVDKEAGKISLGYKRSEDNPWEVLKRDYPVGTVCDAVVVGMTTFGAFARVIPGIDGLIHISQIADRRIDKPQDVLKVGETVHVKITEIDFDKKRVSLSIRALLEDAAPEETAPEAEEAPAAETAE